MMMMLRYLTDTDRRVVCSSADLVAMCNVQLMPSLHIYCTSSLKVLWR